MIYILKDKVPVAEPDVITWAKWFETGDRIVKQTHIDEIFISTVFLGIDHRFIGNGPPILFETMVFDKQNGPDELNRYCTWEEAEKGHHKIVEKYIKHE